MYVLSSATNCLFVLVAQILVLVRWVRILKFSLPNHLKWLFSPKKPLQKYFFLQMTGYQYLETRPSLASECSRLSLISSSSSSTMCFTGNWYFYVSGNIFCMRNIFYLEVGILDVCCLDEVVMYQRSSFLITSLHCSV